MTPKPIAGQSGLTFIELVVTVAILSILASVALPMAEITVRRGHELELREAVRDIRLAIDAYKANYDHGLYGPKVTGASGYPKHLQVLVEKKLLRRLSRDPLMKSVTWGTRSFTDSPHATVTNGTDVYDVFTRHTGVALDGTRYDTW